MDGKWQPANRVGRRQTTIIKRTGDELYKQTVGIWPAERSAEIIKPITRSWCVKSAGARSGGDRRSHRECRHRGGQTVRRQGPNAADLRSFAALRYLWEKTTRCPLRVINQDKQHFIITSPLPLRRDVPRDGAGEIGTTALYARQPVYRRLCAGSSYAQPNHPCPAPPAAISATAKTPEKSNDVSGQQRAPWQSLHAMAQFGIIADNSVTRLALTRRRIARRDHLTPVWGTGGQLQRARRSNGQHVPAP